MAEVQSSGRGASAVKRTEPMLRTPRGGGGGVRLKIAPAIRMKDPVLI